MQWSEPFLCQAKRAAITIITTLSVICEKGEALAHKGGESNVHANQCVGGFFSVKGVKSPFDSYSFLERVKRRLDPYIFVKKSGAEAPHVF